MDIIRCNGEINAVSYSMMGFGKGIKSEKETINQRRDRSAVAKLCCYVHHHLIWLQMHKGTSHKGTSCGYRAFITKIKKNEIGIVILLYTYLKSTWTLHQNEKVYLFQLLLNYLTSCIFINQIHVFIFCPLKQRRYMQHELDEEHSCLRLHAGFHNHHPQH